MKRAWIMFVVMAVCMASLLLSAGCSGGGGDGGDDPNALTLENLQGTFDLDVDALSVTFVCDNSEELTAQVIVIEGNTVTATNTCSDATVETETFTITIIDENTVRDEDGDDLTATLTNGGTRITVLNEDGDTLIYNKR